jgi:hypothetical protein
VIVTGLVMAATDGLLLDEAALPPPAQPVTVSIAAAAHAAPAAQVERDFTAYLS